MHSLRHHLSAVNSSHLIAGHEPKQLQITADGIVSTELITLSRQNHGHIFGDLRWERETRDEIHRQWCDCALLRDVQKRSHQKSRYLLVLCWHSWCQLALWWCRDLCCDLCSFVAACSNGFTWNWMWQPWNNGVSSGICVDSVQIARTEFIWDRLRSNASESLLRIHLKRAHEFRNETN